MEQVFAIELPKTSKRVNLTDPKLLEERLMRAKEFSIKMRRDADERNLRIQRHNDEIQKNINMSQFIREEGIAKEREAKILEIKNANRERFKYLKMKRTDDPEPVILKKYMLEKPLYIRMQEQFELERNRLSKRPHKNLTSTPKARYLYHSTTKSTLKHGSTNSVNFIGRAAKTENDINRLNKRITNINTELDFMQPKPPLNMAKAGSDSLPILNIKR